MNNFLIFRRAIHEQRKLKYAALKFVAKKLGTKLMLQT